MGSESFFAWLLVLVLVALAAFYGWGQVQLLQRLSRDRGYSPEDRRYYRGQAWRRLVGCGLMLVMAGLLVASYGFGQAQQVDQLAREGKASTAGEKPTLTPEKRQFLRQYSQFWIVFALVLLAWLSLAFFDIWAIRRYGRRHFRQIQEEHRAQIENQVAHLRSQRNGHT
jgi:hypothetical protein